MGAATTAEEQTPWRAALGDFFIRCEFTLDELKICASYQNGSAKGRTRENLTIRTMTDPDPPWIDFGFELHIPTVATTSYIHFVNPGILRI